MFAGHFGLTAALKTKTTKVPLWALMLSTQLLDIIFVPLVLLNVETMEGNGYGQQIIRAFYTHSLVGALLIALLAGMGAWYLWGQRAGWLIGAVVMSHWVLDLSVHRPDLPIFPGNLGNLPLMGFGLWRFPVVCMIIEGSLLVLGAISYILSLRARTKTSGRKGWAICAGVLVVVFLFASMFVDVLGLG